MARDLSAELRKRVVAHLNDPTSRTRTIMGADRAYGAASPDAPEWPFVRMDLPVVVPVPDGCSDAAEYSFRIHGFTKGPDERASGALGHAIVADLDGLDGALLVVPDAYLTDTLWTGTQHLRDTVEPDGWHAAVSVTCRVDG